MDAHKSGEAMLKSLKQLLKDERIQRNCAAFRLRVDSGESACIKALRAIETIARGARIKNHIESASEQRQDVATV
jgi:hypothetical protein